MTTLFSLDDPGLIIALCALMAVSSMIQTVTGFGFAILSAPIGAALLGAPQAVTTVILVGTAVDLLILLLRRKRPQPRWDEVAVLALASLPGLALGALLLATFPQRALMLLIAVAVLSAVGTRAWAGRFGRGGTQMVSRRWGVVAGLASGTLGTSTTLAGPPTVLYLAHRPYSPATVRDTLVALNLVRLPLSVLALVTGGVFVVVQGLAWLVIAALAGFVVGDRLFRSLDPTRYETIVLTVLLAAGVTAGLSALL